MLVLGALKCRDHFAEYRRSSSQFVHSRLIFLHALAEAGIMFVTSAMKKVIKWKSTNVVTETSSAVAAKLLDNERIAHSAVQIRISVNQDSMCNVSAVFPLADELQQIDLII